MSTLILVRHGQSAWNLENRFTGWVDVDLTAQGEAEATRAGELMKAARLKPARAFTSMQTRAIRTLNLALDGLGRAWLPVEKDWRLNERHYGALTGLDKSETAAKHGDEQVKIWRRSYDTPPPPLDRDDPRHPRFDERYADLSADQLPDAESLKTTLDRVRPYWSDVIAPRLVAGEDVIVSAHGNSLRALVKLLFDVGDQDIVGVEIPTGNPLVIELALGTVRPVAARYLDEARATGVPALPVSA